jgi:RimJ/RimL family protein N-acetyltransferase
MSFLSKLGPVVLLGTHVRLEPLSQDHHQALCDVGLFPELWEMIPERVQTQEDMAAYIQSRIEGSAEGRELPFATILQVTGQPIGCSRFMNIDATNRRVEIGGTWIAPAFQGTAVNTEAKFLMLRHAFETLGCVRVELKTDALNRRSRAAIERIGAKQEGILRKHILTWSGRWRDTVYFSILDSEWPAVKEELSRKLEARRSA